MRHACHSVLLIASLFITGCRVAEKVKEEKVDTPPATVASVRVAQQTGEGVRLEVVVELTNPNDVALPLKSSSFSVRVGGAAASMSTRPNRTLPARGMQTVVLPIALATGESVSGAQVSVTGTITYEPPGEIRKLLTESKIPLPTTSFSYQGQIQ